MPYDTIPYYTTPSSDALQCIALHCSQEQNIQTKGKRSKEALMSSNLLLLSFCTNIPMIFLFKHPFYNCRPHQVNLISKMPSEMDSTVVRRSGTGWVPPGVVSIIPTILDHLTMLMGNPDEQSKNPKKKLQNSPFHLPRQIALYSPCWLSIVNVTINFASIKPSIKVKT